MLHFRKNLFVLIVFLALPGLVFAADPANTVTLSTYYPAPFGAYDRIRLVPRDSLSAEQFCRLPADVGTIYYDNGLGERQEGIYVCQKMGEEEKTKKWILEWVLISRPMVLEKGSPVAGKVVCIKGDGKLGTCMQNPSSDGSCGCE